MPTLAIDQGTTSTRAVQVDDEGRSTVLLSLTHRQHYPQPGWVEHDANELLANVQRCLDAAAAEPLPAAVGLDNQGESCLAWHAVTGEAISPVIVWQDDRTRPDIERWRADGLEARVMATAGLPLDSYFSASKLGWIMRHVPEAARLAATGKLRLGTTDAFFRDRLTGRHETDPGTASRTSLMGLATARWDASLCELFGVPMQALPAIVDTTGDLGTVRCGRREVPFTASIVDQQAALYGHGCRQAGDVKITFGTGAFALALTGSERCLDAAGALPTVAWRKHGEGTVYALDGGVHTAASAVNWGRELGLFRDYAEIDRFPGPSALSRGLAFVPALSGLACPHWDGRARGGFFGLSLTTTPTDMMQAMLEGIACRAAEVVHAMARQHPIAASISIDGGMSANHYFCQFLADMLGRTLAVSDDPELTARGTAALAAEAAGQPFASTRPGRLVHPRPSGVDGDSDRLRRRFDAARRAVQEFASADQS